jgi:hypothetical protein
VTDAWRADAAADQRLVQPGRDLVAEVLADDVLDRPDHLHRHEEHADDGEWRGQRPSRLHGADGRAHGNGKCRRQRAAEDQERPPDQCEHGICPGQDSEEPPLLPVAQAGPHI